MRGLTLAVLTGATVGCSSVDRQAMTVFEPLDHGSFRYEAIADIVYPENSAAAEVDRMRWLDQYVRDNRVCPGRYDITDRKVVLIRQAALGSVHRIYYRGRCRS